LGIDDILDMSEAWREQQRRSSENVAAAKGLRKKER